MTSVLLLRLQAPMQAWGVQSLFSVRDTTRFPSRSGIIGLLCAAVGKPRDADLQEFNNLRMGVRIDHPGVVMRDFQAAQDAYKAIGGISENPSISSRYYLSDAAFLVGLESQNDQQLQEYYAAVQHPHWLLYLGRRAFPPSAPVWLKNGLLYNNKLEQALSEFPFIHTKKTFDETETLQMMIEDPTGGIVQRDQPVSFERREFVQRIQRVEYIPKPTKCLEEVAYVPE